MPIVFCETRPLAQEWTYRWLGACLAELAAARTAGIEATFAAGWTRARPAPRPADVRAWAREHGIAVSAAGRLPADVVRRYESALAAVEVEFHGCESGQNSG